MNAKPFLLYFCHSKLSHLAQTVCAAPNRRLSIFYHPSSAFFICAAAALCVLSASIVFAGPPTQYNSTTLQPIPYSDPARWHTLLTEKRDSPLIVLGKSDFTISSPLIEGFRPLRHSEGLSRGQRFLRLPIIRLFVPGPMEKPPGGTGHYFAWRNCDLPWIEAASRPGITKGPR